MSFTVLYIDDDSASSILLREVVAILPDSRFLDAATGAAGLALAAAHKPDLIILDIRLPDMSGFDVLKRLKEQAETSGIPVIALSADARPQDVERGRAAGFAKYITKPFIMAEMLRVLSEAAATLAA